jgi:hypothetical protein
MIDVPQVGMNFTDVPEAVIIPDSIKRIGEDEGPRGVKRWGAVCKITIGASVDVRAATCWNGDNNFSFRDYYVTGGRQKGVYYRKQNSTTQNLEWVKAN